MSAENEFRVETWEECEEKIREIEAEHTSSHAGLIFRGQSDACWTLSTTLERRPSRIKTFYDYYGLAYGVKAAIESFTGSKWKEFGLKEIRDWTTNFRSFGDSEIPSYSYLIHLRHHGFPSPLLDWTSSPYIAAFFAFASAKDNQDVTIFAFCEMPQNFKMSGLNAAQVKYLTPYVTTHKRHFLQKARYTICGRFVADDGWHFESHQRVINGKGTHQDVAYKIVVPGSERTKVLKQLDRFNINAFSLFGSEESLMETLAVQEIDLW